MRQINKVVVNISPIVSINLDSFELNDLQLDHVFFVKYLKTMFDGSMSTYKNRFLLPALSEIKKSDRVEMIPLINSITEQYIQCTPFDFVSAFKVEDTALRGLAFSVIDIEKIITKCGGVRTKTEGIDVPQRIYKLDGTYESVDVSLVYELWEVDLSVLDEDYSMGYAVGCWCTSTSEKHFLWVDPENAMKGPIEAVASLCWVWENVLKANPTLKRHGDIFLFETDIEVTPVGDPIPLDKETYFKLLVAQS